MIAAFLVAFWVSIVGAQRLPQGPTALRRALERYASPIDRYVDFGVRLHVVEQDPKGTELIPGRPRLRILRTHHKGGIVDVKAAQPFFCGPSTNPVTWYCSKDQEEILLHADASVPGQLVYGSEGAGKTTVLAMWHVLRGLFPVIGQGLENGQTAPTLTRLTLVRDEMFKLYPSHWYTYGFSENILQFVDGTRIRLVSTHRQSAAVGSPIQGFNWSVCGRDEAQDQIDVHDDIESRGRNARPTYWQLATATAKDNSDWRNLRDQLTSSGLWVRRTLLGKRSPFVAAEFWEQKRRSMDPREYARRVEAKDLGAELAVYHQWRREHHLIRVGAALDLTEAVLADRRSYVDPGARFTLLVGHDPGAIYNTSTIHRCYLINGQFAWVCVGELQTKQTTAGQHAKKLKELLQDFGCELGGAKALIFADPHGKGQASTDYQSVYLAFQKEGLDVTSPQSTGTIKRKARVEMVNRLLCDGDGNARFYVEQKNGVPVAPVLVKSFETLEKREGDDDPEGATIKDRADMTHSPVTVGYALWQFEQLAYTERTQKLAREAAQRRGWRAA